MREDDLITTPDDEPARPEPGEPEQRSVMRELLGDEDADRLEIAPGRWYLPGITP